MYINGFNDDILYKLGLNCTDTYIMRWMLSYFATDRNEKIEEDGYIYKWIKTSKIKHDLPLLYVESNLAIQKMLNRLCGKDKENEEEYPLVKITKNCETGKKMYFRFREEVLAKLEGRKQNDDEIGDGSPVKKVTKEKKKYRLHKETAKILEQVAELKLPNGKFLFSFATGLHRELEAYKKSSACDKACAGKFGLVMDDSLQNEGFQDNNLSGRNRLERPTTPSVPAKDPTIYSIVSNTDKLNLKKFDEIITSLYKGTFSRNYQISPEFLKRNKWYITGENKDIIQRCKGDWKYIQETIYKAANTYRKWHVEGYEPLDKKWLPRNISEWIYNPHTMYSLMYICLVKDPSKLRESMAESVHDNLPKNLLTLVHTYYKPEFDGLKYYQKINAIVKYYNKYKKDLISKDGNCRYLFGKDEKDFLSSYFEFLIELTGNKENIYSKHIGLNCPTWKAYCSSMRKKHELKIALPME